MSRQQVVFDTEVDPDWVPILSATPMEFVLAESMPQLCSEHGLPAVDSRAFAGMYADRVAVGGAGSESIGVLRGCVDERDGRPVDRFRAPGFRGGGRAEPGRYPLKPRDPVGIPGRLVTAGGITSGVCQ
ncbi:hypothetical protein [Nocardia salmonicida]|uniref:hypothetical protein n=1 Tax=Nocardia salmonicida TaxID=53431 RepID=UPI003639EA97